MGPVPLRLLLARSAALLYLTFISSAMVNVVPQAFFARAVPDAKDAWLAGTLLLGTLGSMAGLEAARRVGFPRRPAAVGAALMIGSGALLCASFAVRSAPLYAALCVALRAAVSFATQEIDRRAVALSGAEGRRANDQLGLGMRFGGMLLGPLWFGLFPELGAAVIGGVAALALAALWTVAEVRTAPPPGAGAGGEAAAGAPLLAADRWVIHAARGIYASYFLLASSAVYVLSDLHRLSDAVRRGGVLITVVYGAAIAATAVLSALGSRSGERRSLLGMLIAPAAMLVAGLSLPSRAAASLPVSAAGAVALGVGFAAFHLAFRDHATWGAVRRGRSALLAAYNNLGNTSALVGFAAMTALVGASRALGVEYAVAAAAGAAALGAASIPAVLAGARLSAAAERGATRS